MHIVFTFLAAVTLAMFRAADAGLMTPAMCKTYNETLLYLTADGINSRVDSVLVPSKFARVVEGWFVTLVDEETGGKNGGGTNTDGSYGVFVFPGEEMFPEGYCDIPLGEGGARCVQDGTAVTFTIGPSDVIAFMGCTPPPMRYFSYDVVIDTRLTEEYPYYPRVNFGDTVSNLNINTEGGSSVFDQPALVLHAADSAAAQAVADAYISTDGVSADAVNTRYISPSIARLWDRTQGADWHISRPDILTMVGRRALPEEGSEDAYTKYKNLTWPIRLYVAADSTVSDAPVDPPLNLRESAAVVDEVAKYSDAVAELIEGVKTAVAGRESGSSGAYTYTLGLNATSLGSYDDWDTVLANKNNLTNTYGTRDAMYGIPACTPEGECNMNPTTGVVLVGVLHRDVQQAAYSSAGVSTFNYLTMKYGETHWFMDYELRGSASRFLPEGHAAADALFAVEVLPPGRCAASGVAAAGHPEWCVELEQKTLDKKTMCVFGGERIYSLAATTIGSAAESTITAQLVLFDF